MTSSRVSVEEVEAIIPHMPGAFTILRIRENRLDVISHHETAEQAMEAAQRHASQARFAGLDARIIQRD